MARLPNGDKTGPNIFLITSLDTLRVTLLLPENTKHRKLPKDITPLLITNPNQSQNNKKDTRIKKLNIYLVANEKALQLLNHDYATHTLHETLSSLLGHDTQPITLHLHLKDCTQLDSSLA
jgi:hypothetical protein